MTLWLILTAWALLSIFCAFVIGRAAALGDRMGRRASERKVRL